jgi:peroxidase
MEAQPSNAPANNRGMSNFVYALGQFIDHDLDLTNDGTPADPFNIAVPKGDPQFDPTASAAETSTLSIPPAPSCRPP